MPLHNKGRSDLVGDDRASGLAGQSAHSPQAAVRRTGTKLERALPRSQGDHVWTLRMDLPQGFTGSVMAGAINLLEQVGRYRRARAKT